MSGDNEKRKPKKTAQELVAMLRDEKGVAFTLVDEKQAEEFLSKRNNYLRTASYRKNYPKHTAGVYKGKYIHLEFAYLKELSTLDFYLRDILLGMCIDVEHDLKVSFLQEIESNREEDGYELVREFLRANPAVLASIEKKADAIFTGELIKKYFGVCSVFSERSGRIDYTTRIYDVDCPVWVLEELIGFGEFLRLYAFYAQRNPRFRPQLTMNILNPVKSLRNACAHNNCLLNSLARTENTQPLPEISRWVAAFRDIQEGERKNKLRCRPLFEIVCLLYACDHVVSPAVKQHRLEKLSVFVNNRWQEHRDYFTGDKGNKKVATAMDFLKKVVDNLI